MKIINLDNIINKNDLVPNFKGSHNIYNFQLNNEIYYFKEVPNRELVMELISTFIASILGIATLKENIAILNDKYGLLSKSYLEENDKSYSLYNLMVDYFYENNDDEQLLDYKTLSSLNNLEDIWFALEDKFKDQTTTKEIVDGIVNIFIFDILIGESDRTLRNIEIIDKGFKKTLAPLYDTSSILSSKNTALGVDLEDYLKDDIDKLDKFLEISDTTYKERFYNWLDILNSIGIENIIDSVEKEHSIVIDENLKEEIIIKFNNRMELFKKYKKRVGIIK